MRVKKQQLEPCMGQMIGSKSRKGCQGCLLSPCLFNLYTEHIMRNARLNELQAGIKIGRRNNSHRFVDDITLMAECEEKLKNLLMTVKEESERADLGLNTKKKKKKTNPGLPHCRQMLYHLSHQGSPKIKASNPNTAWQIEGEKVEVVTDFLFLGSKITTEGDCSHEIRRPLFLGRKLMTNVDSVFKSNSIFCI